MKEITDKLDFMKIENIYTMNIDKHQTSFF